MHHNSAGWERGKCGPTPDEARGDADWCVQTCSGVLGAAGGVGAYRVACGEKSRIACVKRVRHVRVRASMIPWHVVGKMLSDTTWRGVVVLVG